MSHRRRPHWLYRIYDSSGSLLYLGCTVDVERRCKQHRSTKGWWRLVQQVVVEGPFDGVIAGTTAEDAAIEVERPLFALSRRQCSQLAAASTHRVGEDGMTPLTRVYPARRSA